MELSRRSLLLGCGALTLGGCAIVERRLRGSAPFPADYDRNSNSRQTARRLNRIGFGTSPFAMNEVRKLGWPEYVERQLRADQPEPPHLVVALSRMDALQMTPLDLRALPEHAIDRQLSQAALLRAIYSPNQLMERMVEFWSDHFNIDSKKSYGSFYLGEFQKEVIRPHALGNFGELLKASAHSPAMLSYLDNSGNRKGAVNENYGRELLELHSLGVDGGYSQSDVQEVARCFTGWGVERGFLRAGGQFRFDANAHDENAKTFLGRRLGAGRGKEDGDDVLDMLATHPNSARHIVGKLCRYFLGYEPAAVRVAAVQAFLTSDGDLRQTLRPILMASELGDFHPELVRRPFDFIVAALRSVSANTDGIGPQAHLEQMRQPLYRWPMPDGYPQRAQAWTSSVLARWNFALALAYGQVAGTEIGLDLAGVEDSLAVACFGEPVPDLDLRWDAESAARVWASPEFQWK